MFKKILGVIGAGIMALALTGCVGDLVEVPPASKGIILGANGYSDDIIPPSRFRLPVCWSLFGAVCDRIVIVQSSDFGMNEELEILIPEDQVQLTADIQFTLGIADNDDATKRLLSRITPTPNEVGTLTVTTEQVYQTYGRSIVRNIVRTVMSRYSIAEIMSNQGAISEELRAEISKALAATTLEVKYLGLARIAPPKIIMDAQEAALERKVSIERAEADAQVAIREAQARLEVARSAREADLLEAQTIREADEILAGGVTPELIRYRELQVLERMAENQNAVFFPVEMTNSLALQNKVFSTNPPAAQTGQ